MDVVDLQVSKARDSFTINAGVTDVDAYRMLWGDELPIFFEQPECTVGARIGQLIENKDKWWDITDLNAAESAADCVVRYVLPFLEKMHSREAMKRWLLDSEVAGKRYPPPIINLASLESFLRHKSQGCTVLAELYRASKGSWRNRIAEVAEHLNCGQLQQASPG